MDATIEKGRRKAIAALILIWVAPLPLLYVSGTQIQWVSMLITALLTYLLFRGANWARVVLGVLTAIGALSVVMATLSALSLDLRSLLLDVMGLAFGVSCVLLLSGDVHEFLVRQRSRR